MSNEVPGGVMYRLSDLIGVSEPALCLLLSVLAGYPLAVVYRRWVYGRAPGVQHLYFMVTGLLLGVANYGYEGCHSLMAVLYTYAILLALGGTGLALACVFLLNMVHLLVGYCMAGTDSYDINWTMPQCVLVLRLIGFAFDYYDGHQPPEKLSAENKKVALVELPGLVEFCGYVYFPASFMVGPQFPMKRYQTFIQRQFENKAGGERGALPASVSASMRRLALGAGYLAVFQLLGLLVSDDYMCSEEFGRLGLLRRCLLLGVWGRYTLYKYISCWLLTEGACILFGVTENGVDERTGETRWDGVANIDLGVFENTTEFNHYIQSFNVNTNHWVAQYIYKRLKFLGNRHLSQLGALLFLAVWHGFHTGYYVCFAFEFIVIYVERDFKSIVNGNDLLTALFASPTVQLVCHLLLRAYTFVFMGWCLLPFALLQFHRYWAAFANVNHIGTLLFVVWPLAYGPLLRLAFRKRKRQQQSEQQQQQQQEQQQQQLRQKRD